MPNPYFRFKQFTVFHDRCAMKVTTDACLFGAWVAHCLSNGQRSRLLDIGAGTGLLSLMVAQKTAAAIDAVEIDQEAAIQAGENSAASPWRERLKVKWGDIRAMDGKKTYDAIFSNPPFYEQDLPSSQTARNTAHHSTELKLGELLETIDRQLAEDGQYFLLLPFRRKEEALRLIAHAGLSITELVEVYPSVQHLPFRVMVRGNRGSEQSLRGQTLYIKGTFQEYSPEFLELLKDYYLYLPS